MVGIYFHISMHIIVELVHKIWAGEDWTAPALNLELLLLLMMVGSKGMKHAQ
jgi:hypothetical protein